MKLKNQQPILPFEHKHLRLQTAYGLKAVLYLAQQLPGAVLAGNQIAEPRLEVFRWPLPGRHLLEAEVPRPPPVASRPPAGLPRYREGVISMLKMIMDIYGGKVK